MKAVNITGAAVRFQISRGAGESPEQYELRPGEFCDLPDAYCTRLQAPSGPQQSVVEKLTGGQVAPETVDAARRLIAAAKAAPAVKPKIAPRPKVRRAPPPIEDEEFED